MRSDPARALRLLQKTKLRFLKAPHWKLNTALLLATGTGPRPMEESMRHSRCTVRACHEDCRVQSPPCLYRRSSLALTHLPHNMKPRKWPAKSSPKRLTQGPCVFGDCFSWSGPKLAPELPWLNKSVVGTFVSTRLQMHRTLEALVPGPS